MRWLLIIAVSISPSTMFLPNCIASSTANAAVCDAPSWKTARVSRGAAAEAVEAGQQPAARLPIDRVMRVADGGLRRLRDWTHCRRASAAGIRHSP